MKDDIKKISFYLSDYIEIEKGKGDGTYVTFTQSLSIKSLLEAACWNHIHYDDNVLFHN